jgi:hypothetical protein
MKKILFTLVLYLTFINLHAIEFKGKFYQGNLILGKVTKGYFVKVDNKKLKLTRDGYFVFGLSKDRTNDVIVEISNNKETIKLIKKVFKKKYNIQKIDGLAKKHVTPPKEV